MEAKSRLLHLDQFRGLAVLLMVFANALAHYERVPSYLQHAAADGYTLPDIVMPMFLFAMGYAAQLSFRSRVNRNGVAKTILHFLIRGAILIGYGFLGTLLVENHPWDILETLGVTGLLALPLLFLPPVARLTIASLSLIAYQVGMYLLWSKTVDRSGSPGALVEALGTFSVLFIHISGSCLSAWLKEKPYASRVAWLATTGAILIVLAVALNPFVPFNKHLVSVSYVLLSTGSCACGLLLFMVIAEQLHLSIPPLEALGRNALLLYMLSSVLILGENVVLPGNVSLVVCVAGFGAVMFLTYLTAAILDWKKIYVKL
jgi:predicted acyltransferase